MLCELTLLHEAQCTHGIQTHSVMPLLAADTSIVPGHDQSAAVRNDDLEPAQHALPAFLSDGSCPSLAPSAHSQLAAYLLLVLFLARLLLWTALSLASAAFCTHDQAEFKLQWWSEALKDHSHQRAC